MAICAGCASPAGYAVETIALGASIACGGPCLTAVATGHDDGGWFEVDVGAETLARTSAGTWGPARGSISNAR